MSKILSSLVRNRKLLLNLFIKAPTVAGGITGMVYYGSYPVRNCNKEYYDASLPYLVCITCGYSFSGFFAGVYCGALWPLSLTILYKRHKSNVQNK